MTDFKQMIEQMPLRDIEQEIHTQTAAAAAHPNRMKLAVMLSMIASEAIAAIDAIDTSALAPSLRQRLEQQRAAFEERRRAIEEHLGQNAAISQAIDGAEASLDDISRRATEALSDFDARLADLVRARDLLPIEDLKQPSADGR